VRCEQLAVDLAHGELLARLGEGFVELEGALLGVLELRAQLALAADRPQTNGKACVLAWPGRPAGRRGSPRLSV
jgi:hypothetical protein